MSRVVVVDDHPVFRKGLAALLRSDGHDVVAEASDGLEAIALVEQERPDLVLMDLSMPIRDGFEATAHITARHPGTRVVVITLFDDEASVARPPLPSHVAAALPSMTPRELVIADLVSQG